MTRRFKTVSASTAIALVTNLPAVAETTAGTLIAAETLVDHAEVVRVADTIEAAVDAKD
ncbi:MAG: hypothetical protein AAFV54_06070 [Pseudomonadota bacterium]